MFNLYKIILNIAVLSLVGNWTVAQAANADSTLTPLSTQAQAVVGLRPAVGAVPVAFLGKASFGCPPQATTSVPPIVSTGGTLINYDLTASSVFSSAFYICNIGIEYYPDTESISAVATSVYNLATMPSTAPCSTKFGSAFNTTCQMYPILPPNTSVCYDDSAFLSVFGSNNGACLIGATPQDVVNYAYFAPQSAYLTYGGQTQNVGRCGTSSLAFYVPPSVGPNVNYSFTYDNAMNINSNACGTGSRTGYTWICSANRNDAAVSCPGTFPVTIVAGKVNKIVVTPYNLGGVGYSPTSWIGTYNPSTHRATINGSPYVSFTVQQTGTY